MNATGISGVFAVQDTKQTKQDTLIMAPNDHNASSENKRPGWLVPVLAAVLVLAVPAYLFLTPGNKAPKIEPVVKMNQAKAIQDPFSTILPDKTQVFSAWLTTPAETRQRARKALDETLTAAKSHPWPNLPKPVGPLGVERRKRLDAWMETFYRQAYADAGSHNPSWDAAVQTYIGNMAIWLASGGRATGLLSTLESEGALLESLSCDDPMVTYWLGSIKERQAGPEAAEPYLRRALDGLKKSRYPALMSFYAARRLTTVLPHRSDQENNAVQAMRKTMLVSLGRAAGDRLLRNDSGRDLFSLEFGGLLGTQLSIEELKTVAETAAGLPDSDPWAVALVQDAYHLELASQAQHKARTNPADKEALATFKKEMNAAYNICLAGWKTDPPRPELTAQLVEISRVLKGLDEAMPWFERTVQAQYDYMTVYHTLVAALSPTSGGNLVDLLRFGRALGESKRYDTWVPYMAVRCIIAGAEAGGREWREIWRHKDIGQRGLAIWKAYQAKPDTLPEWSAWDRRSIGYAMAWATGDYALAATLRTALKNGWNEAVVETVVPMAKPRIMELETAIGSGRYSDVLQQVLVTLDHDPAQHVLGRLHAFVPRNQQEADALVHLLDRAADYPLGPEAKDDTELFAALQSLLRREPAFLLYYRGLREHRDNLPADLEGTVVETVGIPAMPFLGTVPPVGRLSRSTVAEGLEKVEAITSPEKGRMVANIETPEMLQARFEDEKALAQLRWLLQANLVKTPEAHELFVTRMVQPQVAKIQQKGLLLDFAEEWLAPGRLDTNVAMYVGHLLQETAFSPSAAERKAEQQTLESLKKISESDLLKKTCREAFFLRGTPGFALQLAHLLDERGLYLEAAVLRHRVRRWLWRLYLATRPLEAWSPWHSVVIFNRVPGYEDDVLTYARRGLEFQPVSSFHYVAAAAALRKNWVRGAVHHLLRAKSLPDNVQRFEDPDGTFTSCQDYAKHLADKIRRSGKASKEELAALDEAFRAKPKSTKP